MGDDDATPGRVAQARPVSDEEAVFDEMSAGAIGDPRDRPARPPDDPRSDSRVDSVEILDSVELSEFSRGDDDRDPRTHEAIEPRFESATAGERPPRPPPLPDDSGGRTSFPPVSIVDPRIGTTLNGRYRLEKLIGKGGMGRVYLSTQFPLNRHVALKILNPDFQRKDPQFVRRFFLEASTAARLTHPNTITVFDYGESESGELFIVMEFLKGRPLSRVITADGPFNAERTLHIALQICRALREAHSKGIIHRDLKPGNILLLEEGDDADFVKVLDFGLVKLFTPPAPGQPQDATPAPELEGELTRAGMFLGSPKYMSPEQIQGAPLDPRTDIYALGVLMFQMLAGKPPFTGSTSVEVIFKHVNHPVPAIAGVAPGVEAPEELELVIRRCMEKKRDDRFPSMGELLVKLKDVRRLITGISSASEIGVSVSALLPHAAQVAVSNPGVAPLEVGAISHSGSRPRPQTHPVAGAPTPSGAQLRSTVPSQPGSRGGIPRRPANAEAQFNDIADDPTPSNIVRARQNGRSGSPGPIARLAPAIAGTALVLALGVLAYVFSSSPPPAPAQKREAEAAVASEVRVTFASTPEGAEVFEGSERLGETPFVRTYSGVAADDRPHRFVFKLDGFMEEVVAEKLETASVKIHARMRVNAGRDPEPQPPIRGSDYKENPY